MSRNSDSARWGAMPALRHIWLGWVVKFYFRPEISHRLIFFFPHLLYLVGMDELIPLDAGFWKLLLAPKSLRPPIFALIARLVERGSLLVLDGGNQFNAFRVARLVGGQSQILGRIKISRAFTCYQMLSLLEGLNPVRETILLLDFLATFHDESASFADRTRLLALSLARIRKLSRHNGLLVTVHPPAIASPESESLIAQLAREADGVWMPETPAPMVSQLALFQLADN